MQKLSGWGRYPAYQPARIHRPDTPEAVQALVQQGKGFTPRGNGRSYGDAALGSEIIDLRKLAQVIDFQENNGILICEAGVLFSDLIDIVVPAGWFFPVTPGVKSITVGGAIASNVHGKNHLDKGCISNWILHFDLLCADGQIRRCSPTEHPELFRQTFGAQGMTGIIVRAGMQLIRISSTRMLQRTETTTGISALLHALQNAPEPYVAAWLDLLQMKSTNDVRGVLYAADHDTTSKDLRYRRMHRISIPCTPPINLVRKPLMRLYNTLIWRKAKRMAGKVLPISMDQYFYPLDSLGNWNRLYGPAGFIQYQCCLPQANANHAMHQFLTAISEMSYKPCLVVVKRHGATDPRFPNSFPDKGFSIALDYPNTDQIRTELRQLDQLVWQLGGKIYLAKDALSHGRMSRLDWPALHKLWSPKFSSAQQSRIKADEPQ